MTSALMVELARDLAPLSAEQGRINREASRLLSDAFHGLDFSDPGNVRDVLLEAYPAIADTYSEAAATATAEWYEAQRVKQIGRPGGFFGATVAELPPIERLQESVRWAAGQLWSDNPLSTLDLLDGSLSRTIEDMGRETILETLRHDKYAYGFHRVARATGCDFCVMLSQRGAVYRRDTAGFAAHDNCGCKAAPSWDPDAPEVDVRAYEMSKRRARDLAELNDPNTRPSRRQAIRDSMDYQRTATTTYLVHNKDELDAYRAELP